MKSNSVVDTLKTCVGDNGFNAVVAAFGGQELFVPTNPCGNSFEAIVNGVGRDVAASLVDLFSGDTIYIPNGKRISAAKLKDDVTSMHQQGMGIETIAKKKNITTRWVRAIITMNRNKK